jgi:hypothetical protein
MLTPRENQAVTQVVVSDNLRLWALAIYFAYHHPDLLVIAQQEIEDRAALN